jgi:hypothetical protein
MGLIGRLEDLPLSDIIQIVHLSRRTGSLDIERQGETYRILFQKGMIVFAQSPGLADLEGYFQVLSPLPPDRVVSVLELYRSIPGTPLGDFLLEMQHLAPQDLGSIIYLGIMKVLDPLLDDKEGTFSFTLNEGFTPHDLGYSPDTLFKTGGFPPARIMQKGKDREISILKDIQESLSRGKELVRGDYAPPPAGARPPPPPPPLYCPPPRMGDRGG